MKLAVTIVPGTDGVDEDPVGRERLGQVLGDAGQRGLGGGVGDEHRVLALDRVGRQVHDPGPLGLRQQGQGGPGAVHRGHRPEPERRRPVVVAEILEASGAGPDGVHEGVELAPPLVELGECPLDLRPVADVDDRATTSGLPSLTARRRRSRRARPGPRARIATRAPSPARHSATARPMPLLPPATATALPPNPRSTPGTVLRARSRPYVSRWLMSS